jgi:uncharacterized coiled-coil DUF342 family protein
MSQIDTEQIKERVNELVKKAEELKKTASELHEKLKDSELARRVERLGEAIDTLKKFTLRYYSEFSLVLKDTCASVDCKDIEVFVVRSDFYHVIKVKHDTSVVDIYKIFFDDQSVLEKMISNLVGAMINVAESVKRDVDLLAKISELERNIEFMSRELDDIEEKLEDP